MSSNLADFGLELFTNTIYPIIAKRDSFPTNSTKGV